MGVLRFITAVALGSAVVFAAVPNGVMPLMHATMSRYLPIEDVEPHALNAGTPSGDIAKSSAIAVETPALLPVYAARESVFRGETISDQRSTGRPLADATIAPTSARDGVFDAVSVSPVAASAWPGAAIAVSVPVNDALSSIETAALVPIAETRVADAASTDTSEDQQPAAAASKPAIDQQAAATPAGPGPQPQQNQSPGATTLPLPLPSQTPVKVPVIPAKVLFGAAKTPSPLAARAIGSYAKGCLSGGVALPVDGPAWQAMRLSRNRNWGHPKLIELVERLADDGQKKDNWSGLLVGDISQPRGGPMVSGHASHQIGLDADVWLTQMPPTRLSKRQRESLDATSMLDTTGLLVDPGVFTAKHVDIIKRAATYSEVERVLVHPAIKKALCEAAGTDRQWLGKVRPIYGHFYHFHIRIKCPAGFAGCTPQAPPTGDDGCGKEVTDWLARVKPKLEPAHPAPPNIPPSATVKPGPVKPGIGMAELPQECRAVLESGPDGIPVPPDPPAAAKAAVLKHVVKPAAAKPKVHKAIQSRRNGGKVKTAGK